MRSGMRLDLACYPQVNQFRGCRTVQLLITDIRRALSPAMVDLRIYQRFRAGEMLSNQELRRLLPQRQDFVATWRYLAHYAGKGTLTEQPLALSNRIARTFGLPCGCSRTLICLDVLQERGLIDLAAEPEVLLMDEPTSALDPISTGRIEELALELKKTYTIVIVTHNMQQAARISDKCAFFLVGDLIEFGETEQVFSMPKDKRTEDYITGRFG